MDKHDDKTVERVKNLILSSYLDMDASDLAKRMNAGMSAQEAVKLLLNTAIPEVISAYRHVSSAALSALPAPADDGPTFGPLDPASQNLGTWEPARDDALEGLRELSERATKGEWGAADWGYDDGYNKCTIETSRPEVLSPGQSSIWPGGLMKLRIASTEECETPLEDAAFIAAAVNYVRAKLAAPARGEG